MSKLTSNIELKTFELSVDSTPSFMNGVAGHTSGQDSNMHIIDREIANRILLNGVGNKRINFVTTADGALERIEVLNELNEVEASFSIK